MINIKRRERKNLFMLISIEMIVGAVFAFYITIFQINREFMNVMDAIMIVGVVIFLFGIIFLLSTFGIYEFFEFIIKFIWAKIRRTHFDYTLFEAIFLREKSERVVHRSFLITGGFYLLIGIVLYYMYYNDLTI